MSRYIETEELGVNQFARVFEAADEGMLRDVAIMEFHDRFRDDHEQWNQIWPQILGRTHVKHDHLVAIHDSIPDRGWIVMERMKGNYAEFLEGPGLSPDVVRGVMVNALEALSELHQQGYVHGDIKPKSLLYDRSGSCKLGFSPGLEFGGMIPHEGRNMKYVAPEMLESSFGTPGPATDMYCLGFTILELLVGNDFEKQVVGIAESVDARMSWIRWHSSQDDRIGPVEQLVRGIPSDLANVINRAINKRVDERFHSAQEALDLLDQDAGMDSVFVLDHVELPEPIVQPERRERRHVSVPASGAQSKPARKESAHRSSNRTSSKPVAVHPQWSKEWINQKLEKPYVLYPVIGMILLVTWFAIMSGSDSSQPSRRVTIASQPAGAEVRLYRTGSEELLVAENTANGANKTPFDVSLPPGDYHLVLSHEGYETLENSGIKLTADLNGFADTFRLIPTLPPIPDDLNVVLNFKDVAPEDVRVFVDGKERMSNSQDEILIAGKDLVANSQYRLELIPPDGFEKVEASWTAQDLAKKKTLDFEFQPIATPTERVKFIVANSGNTNVSATVNREPVETTSTNQFEFDVATGTTSPEATNFDVTVVAKGFEKFERSFTHRELLSKTEHSITLTELVTSPQTLSLAISPPDAKQVSLQLGGESKELSLRSDGRYELALEAFASLDETETTVEALVSAENYQPYQASWDLRELSQRGEIEIRLLPRPSKSDAAIKLYEQGLARFDKMDFAAAAELFAQAINKDQEFWPAYRELGHSLYFYGDVPQAVEYLKQARALNEQQSKSNSGGQDELILLLLGNCYQDLSLHREAIETYQVAIDLGVNLAIFHTSKAESLLLLGQDDLAEQDCLSALTLDSRWWPANNILARIHHARGDLAGALNHTKTALAIDPRQPEPWFNKGMIHISKSASGGEKDISKALHSALEAFDQSIKLAPNFSDAFVGRGVVNFRLGDFNESIADCTKAISFDERNALAFLHRSHASKAVGDFAKATQDMRRYRQLSDQK